VPAKGVAVLFGVAVGFGPGIFLVGCRELWAEGGYRGSRGLVIAAGWPGPELCSAR
jgi:hypothetical protein